MLAKNKKNIRNKKNKKCRHAGKTKTIEKLVED